MTWLDYAILLVIGLGALQGFWRGFIVTLFRFVGLIAAIYASWRYAPALVSFAEHRWALTSKIASFVVKHLPLIPPQAAVGSALSETVNTLPYPALFKGILLRELTSSDSVLNMAKSIAEQVAEGLASLMVSLLAYFVIFAVISSLMAMLAGLLQHAAGDSLSFLGLNRLLGFILGGAVNAVMLTILLGFLFPFVMVQGGGAADLLTRSKLVEPMLRLFYTYIPY